MRNGEHGSARPLVPSALGQWVSRLIGETKETLTGPLVSNAASLYGSTLVTSFFGFFYWLIAARMVPARAVGLASAVQSAAVLLSVLCVLGLSTLLISELAADKSKARGLIMASSAVAGGVTIIVSAVAAVGLRTLSSVFHEGLPGLVEILVFVGLCTLTTVLRLLDDACIGMLRGDLQLKRNTVFAISKLAVLPVLVVLWATRSGAELVTAWTVGLAVSLVVLLLGLRRLTPGQSSRPDFRWLFDKRQLMMGHQWLNISIDASAFLLPIFVVTILGARANAAYTAAILVVGFVNVIPHHLSAVLFALVPGDEVRLRREVQKTMRICLPLAICSALLLLFLSHLILGVFGRSYQTATAALIILGLTTYPSAIKSHYVAISRVRGKMGQAAFRTLLGSCIEIGFAALGGVVYGLTGIAAGYLAGYLVEMVILGPVVFGVLRAARQSASADQLTRPQVSGDGET